MGWVAVERAQFGAGENHVGSRDALENNRCKVCAGLRQTTAEQGELRIAVQDAAAVGAKRNPLARVLD